MSLEKFFSSLTAKRINNSGINTIINLYMHFCFNNTQYSRIELSEIRTDRIEQSKIIPKIKGFSNHADISFSFYILIEYRNVF